ncbi:MAG: alpha/beta hydrolase [Candidatus Omnitrophota bacterium]|jgi:hypothetical protein
MEKTFFFKNQNNQKLFGILFCSESPVNKFGIVICQPIAEERHRTKRVFVNFSRQLASEGLCVFLFDYFGEGDSEGSFEEADITSRIADIKAAIDFLRQETKVERLGLVGISFGAALAGLVDPQKTGIDFKVLWHPVINGNEYVLDWLRINLASQMANFGKIKFSRQKLIENISNEGFIEVEGFILNQCLLSQLKKVDLLMDSNGQNVPTLVVELAERINLPDRFIKNFLTHCKEKNKPLDYLLLARVFNWKSAKNFIPDHKELFEKTLSWIKDKA